MHGKDFEDLAQHEPDALYHLVGFKDFVSRNDVTRWDTFLVHHLKGLLNVVQAWFPSSRLAIQTCEVQVWHVELEDVTEQHSCLKILD